MTDSLRFYKDLCSNRVLEFPVNIFLTETHIFTYVLIEYTLAVKQCYTF